MITRFSGLRYFRVAAFAIGAIAIGGMALITASAAGFSLGLRAPGSSQTVSADTTAFLDQTSTTTSPVCTDFISHLSGDLGKSQSQVTAAIQKAIGETLADQVKAGKLTQAQADAIKKRLTNQPVCSLPGGFGKRPFPTAPFQGGAYLQQLETAAASALGISTTQLKTDLAGGMSLSQIAAAQKPPMSEATFRTRLIAQLKPLLDTAVKNKTLTQNQEDLLLKRLQNGPIPLWSTPIRKHPAAASPTPA